MDKKALVLKMSKRCCVYYFKLIRPWGKEQIPSPRPIFPKIR